MPVLFHLSRGNCVKSSDRPVLIRGYSFCVLVFLSVGITISGAVEKCCSIESEVLFLLLSSSNTLISFVLTD